MKKKVKKIETNKNFDEDILILEEIDYDIVINISAEIKISLKYCALIAADGFKLKGYKITPKG